MPILYQALDQTRDTWGEHVRSLGENVWKGLAQGAQPLSHRNPTLEQKGADLVDHCCALADQAGANTMQSLQVKLLDRFGGHKPHGGAEHGLGYRLSVSEVIFV